MQLAIALNDTEQDTIVPDMNNENQIIEEFSQRKDTAVVFPVQVSNLADGKTVEQTNKRTTRKKNTNQQSFELNNGEFLTFFHSFNLNLRVFRFSKFFNYEKMNFLSHLIILF